MLSFGMAVFGIGMMDYAITVFLLFYYSDILLLGAAAAGTAYFIGKIWDAFTDPFMGYISDHTRSRLGRRRPYLLACPLPLGFSFFLLWTPMLGYSQTRLFLHLLVSAILFYTFLTMFYIPYNALGAELTPHYHERTVLMGVRQGVFIFGLLIGAVTPMAITRHFVEKISLALTMLLVGAILSLIGYVANHEQSPETIFGMRMVFACVPGILYLCATTTFAKFPITRAVHEEIMEQLARRKAAS
jgi:oligogalacturonide transporter